MYLTLAEANLLASKTKTRKTKVSLKPLFLSAFLAVGIFLAISAPSQILRLDYWWRDWLGLETPQYHSGFSPSNFLSYATKKPKVDIPTNLSEGELVIPSIDVDAPIAWNIPLQDALNGLQQGVVQASQSKLPGEVGRTFIIGHSSGYWWNKNPWTKVFALLDKVKNGDYIFLQKDGKVYAYQVASQEVVTPRDVQVVRDDQLNHNQLTLMTCTPVGTTLNRLIVYAEPVGVWKN